MMKWIATLALALLPSFGFAAGESGLPNPQVIIKTNFGDITVRLFKDKAPVTVDNFLGYVDSGHYSNTIFHRVVSNFMIQGGGYTTDFTEKATGEPIINESKNRVHNVRGTIAMARLNDPDSATAQFYINHRTNLSLDWTPTKPGYTVFGEVIHGMNVVDFIASAPVQAVAGHQHVPTEPVVILGVERKSLL